ncbi:MAG: hypothetical protein LC792_21290 [Actinobacteria bacterium]|nr:hypothetical protein [Actinomycetota bacterium]
MAVAHPAGAGSDGGVGTVVGGSVGRGARGFARIVVVVEEAGAGGNDGVVVDTGTVDTVDGTGGTVPRVRNETSLG